MLAGAVGYVGAEEFSELPPIPPLLPQCLPGIETILQLICIMPFHEVIMIMIIIINDS